MAANLDHEALLGTFYGTRIKDERSIAIFPYLDNFSGFVLPKDVTHVIKN